MENKTKDGGAKKAPSRQGVASAIEKTAQIQLANRAIWLVVGLTLYLIAQLTFVQWKYEGFETLALMSHITVLIELCLTVCAVILVVATPATVRAWKNKYDTQVFDYLASGIAGLFVIILVAVIMLAPVLVIHRYPAVSGAGYSIPLMMLQRTLYITFVVMTAYNLALICRYLLKFPGWLAGLTVIVSQIFIGYFITYLSFTNEMFSRLNDVFYYNQLWRYIDIFPRMQSPEVAININRPYFGFFAFLLVVWLFTMFLWLPSASILTQRMSKR